MSDLEINSVIAIIVLFIISAFYAIYIARSRLKIMSRSSSFIETKGKILKSSIRGLSRLKEARPLLSFSYVVNGKEYISWRVSFWWSDWRGSLNDVQGIVKEYAVGKTVQVFYDPENPKFAVLDRKFSKDAYNGSYRYITIASIGLVVCLVMIVAVFSI